MRKSFLGSLSLFVLVVSGVGCTATITPAGSVGSGSCTAEASVRCQGGSSGFACTGIAVPEDAQPALLCSVGVPNGSFTDYCCTSSSSASCSTDPSLRCSPGTGYSCSGNVTPEDTDPTLACSSGLGLASGLVGYCCVPGGLPTGSSCAADASVAGCQLGSFGYSCTGTTRPEDVQSTLVCSDGVANGSSTDYCCIAGFTSTTCTPDVSIQGCVGASFGFRCTGTASPSATDASLTCSTGTPDAAANTLDYCCQTTNACIADGSVTGCVAGSTGYSCTGTATPDPALNCSTGAPGTTSGTTIYCCGATSGPGTCASDASVTGCAGGSTGYSCTGVTRPDADGSLQCSSGVAGVNGSTDYCCFSAPTTTSTCTADPTVTGCTGGSFGFACSGTDTPADSNTNLVCGPGAAGNDGNTLYCCASR
jgi:hypothetical protein